MRRCDVHNSKYVNELYSARVPWGGGGGEENDRTATSTCRVTVFGALGGRGGVQHTIFDMCRNRLMGGIAGC